MKDRLQYADIMYDSEMPGDQARYLADAVAIAADGFGQNAEVAAFRTDVETHLRGHRVILAYDEGAPIGFVSMRYFPEEGGVLYVSGMVVTEAYQAHGVGHRLALRGAQTYTDSGDTIRYIAGRTQNPAVARARGKYCPAVYPITHRPDAPVMRVAATLYDALDMQGDIDLRTLVCKNVYPHALSTRRLSSNDVRIDRFFAENVGERDAVFIVGIPHLA